MNGLSDEQNKEFFKMLVSLSDLPDRLKEMSDAVRELKDAQIRATSDSKRWEERHSRIHQQLDKHDSDIDGLLKLASKQSENLTTACGVHDKESREYTDKRTNRAIGYAGAMFSLLAVVMGSMFIFLMGEVSELRSASKVDHDSLIEHIIRGG